MRTADVVVIGGGAIGTSTAFHLTALGVRDVLLLERRHLAAGATGKSGALVRMHYTNEAESRLAHESLKVFRDFDTVVGGDPGFEAVGFLQLVAPEFQDALRRNVARQRALGIDTQAVSLDDVRRVLPEADLAGVGAAAWEPGSGFADPGATAYAFAEAARRGGATIVTHCEALRIVVEGGRVAGVETTGGRVATGRVVLAAGAWAQPLLAPFGLDYGLTPYRIQVSIFRWPAGFRRRHPAVIDATRKSWFRPEGACATLVGVELGVAHADPEKYDEGVDESYVAGCREALAARLPQFADAPMRGGWAGMIMMSPDGRPIIDRLPAADGLWAMLGDSGTSFKTAPAIGRCLAEWIVTGAPTTADLAPFRATRFAEGRPWVDADHYGRERLTVSR
ncbi:MAG TPA: FAD-binding oxidoreductase [Methylomirabilota bacterium]|jgi:sarcosine oxidase subunit beta|nr:FAD-binding oxidoreductase [Methylomirabilota bacterium]